VTDIEKTERYQLAVRNVADWCREQASEHHGYVPIATSTVLVLASAGLGAVRAQGRARLR
jgi:hypothetical protein